MRLTILCMVFWLVVNGLGSCTPPVDLEGTKEKRFLWLMRHSKASDKEKYEDLLRPLTKKGEKQARKIGAYIKAQGKTVDCILSSSATRNKETALLVAKELGYPTEKIRIDSSLYKCKTRVLIEAIKSLPDSCREVLVIGHNPSTIQAANHFQRDTIFTDVPTSGLIGIKFSEQRWSIVGHKEGKFDFFTHPRHL